MGIPHYFSLNDDLYYHMPAGITWGHCDLRSRVRVQKVASVHEIFSLDNVFLKSISV